MSSTVAYDDCNIIGNESSSQVDKKKRKSNSAVWEDFEKLPKEQFRDGKPKSKCKHCGKLYSGDSSAGTSNLHRHILSCPKKAKKEERENSTKRFDQNVYKEKIAIAIMRHAYPFRFAEHERNREIHTYLNGAVKPISRNTIRAYCFKVHKKERENLKLILEKLSSRICLTCDMWTSLLSQGYLCLTEHYVDEHWRLNSKILSFCHVPPPHSAVILYQKVYKILKDWNIAKKIFTITLDNARCNDIMQDHLLNRLNNEDCLPCKGDFFHIRCAAHILNLIVKDGLKVINCAIKNIREGIKYVVGSEARKLKFEECAQLVGCDCSKGLWLDCVTRWNSTYKMLARALIYRDAFAHLKLVDDSFVWYPTDEEWVKVEKICELLKHFDTNTILFSGSEYPTANLYFHHVWRIELCLLEGMEHSDPHINEMSKEMKIKFDKYWSDYSVILFFAIILDPRYKLDFVKFCFNKLDSSTAEEKVDKIHSDLLRLFKDYASKNSDPSSFYTHTGNSITIANREEDYITEFEFFEAHQVDPEQMELDLYLKELKESRQFKIDVLVWWKSCQHRFPILSLMAKDILSIPITTVASESAFSMGGRVITKWRASLLPETAQTLITTRNWLYGYQVDDDDDEELDGIEIQFSKTASSMASNSLNSDEEN